MGTKNNPGKFDCHDKALPDEPMFTILGRDPMGAHLVSIWSKLRQGDTEAARAVFDHLIERAIVLDYPRPETTDVEKAQEAGDCSRAMFDWRKANPTAAT